MPLAALAWLGRQGTRAIAVLVFLGIAFPPFGAMLTSYVTPAVLILLLISVMRADVAAMRGYLRIPVMIAL